MPWWWVVPAAIGGYYLAKEVLEEEPTEDSKPKSDAGSSTQPLPRWSREIDPLTWREFIQRHGDSLIPSSPQPSSPSGFRPIESSGPTRSSIRTVFQRLFVPISILLLVGLVALDATGSLAWSLVWGGLIGYGTNWLAIQMLFHPREPRPLFHWRGVLASRKEEITLQVTHGVVDHLFNEEIVQEFLSRNDVLGRLSKESRDHLRHKLDQSDFRRDIHHLVLGWILKILQNSEFRSTMTRALRERVDRWAGQDVRGRLASLAALWWEPRLQREISSLLDNAPEIVDQIRSQIDRSLDELPQILEQDRETLERGLSRSFLFALQRLDISRVIQERLQTVTDDSIENWIMGTAYRELSLINLLGGLLGIAGGLVIVRPDLGLFLGLTLAMMAALDETLNRRQRRKSSKSRYDENPPS